MPNELISRLDAIIRRDPAGRGLLSAEPELPPICPGHLAEASAHLAECGRHIAIVTGFFISRGEPPAAETDGPPGALLLAESLRRAGIDTTIVTDGFCWSAVAAAARATGFPLDRIAKYPQPSTDDRQSTATWRRDFFDAHADLTHLIAVERIGPAHTLESVRRSARQGPAAVRHFESIVPVESRDCCHNMRGEIVDEFTGDLHRLFEELARHRPAGKTIGIGDGGNEIGMGSIPWADLVQHLGGETSARIACRVPCDWNIVAGTSNWGAYALAAAVLDLRGMTNLLRPFTAEHQRCVLEAIVENGPAVDGVTRRREPTVDGLPFETYIRSWHDTRHVLGLP
jgi:hypothetical protein